MKTRIVQTRFWKDEYITGLNPEEKLVFLYLLTNDTIGLTGMYQLYPEEIALWCGISLSKAKSILGKFSKDKKIYYQEGWVKIVNYDKYQNFNSGNRKAAFKRELSLIPLYIKDYEVDPKSTLGRPEVDPRSVLNTKSKIINKNIKIKNKKNKKRKKQKKLKDILDHWNKTFGTSLKSVKGFESIGSEWLEEYSVEEINAAIDKIPSLRSSGDWLAKMVDHPTKLFRTRNKNGPVDYIGELLSKDKTAPVKEKSQHSWMDNL